MSGARVAVIGAGIAGLAAALRLRDRLGPAAEITVWDKDDRAGGKLHTGTVAGLAVEWGADAFLMRDPSEGGDSAAVTLARRLGLELVHPEPVTAGDVGRRRAAAGAGRNAGRRAR